LPEEHFSTHQKTKPSQSVAAGGSEKKAQLLSGRKDDLKISAIGVASTHQ